MAGQHKRDSLGGGDDAAFAAQATANRIAAAFFEKYERAEVQEMLAYTSYHWYLSADEFKVPIDPPKGLIASMKPISENHVVFLMPVRDDIQPLDFREIHQIVRELVIGIYCLNQSPCISLDANFDQSTSCQLPPAYNDTRVGQLLINVDYMMKALWHGAYFPKDKRTKFSERWRSNLDVNANGKPETKKTILTEFTAAGMLDISKDPDFAGVYGDMKFFPMSEHEAMEDKKLFFHHVDDISMQMILSQNCVYQHHNLFVIDADYKITNVVRLAEDKIDRDSYERLQTRLLVHQEEIKKYVQAKAETRKNIHLLRFVSFMVPFLMGMKKRNKVPDVNRLVTPLTADECRTERELPPLMLGKDFKCKNFDFLNKYFHLHGGIQIDCEPYPVSDPSQEVIDAFEELQLQASTHLAKITDPEAPYQDSFPIPIREFNGKKYYVIAMDFETYYPQSPQKPLWVHAFYDKIKELKPKRLPLTDVHMHEQFKKRYGVKRAIKNKNIQVGLKSCAHRGLVSMLATLVRKTPGSRISKQDDNGFSLMHHAALQNKPQIISLLIIQGQDMNVRRNNNILSTAYSLGKETPVCPPKGPTPLHLAARCGSLDSAACLIGNKADMYLTDQDGWAAIHHAAFFDHEPIVRHFCRKWIDQIELETMNQVRQTPLLLAASSGALDSVKTLIDLGANIKKRDLEGNNMIHLAAMRFHTNVLEYYIEWNHKDVPVWNTLVEMMTSNDLQKIDSAVRSLEILSTSKMEHWKSILDADGIPALVNILKLENEELQSLAASVLCNISERKEIRLALSEAKAIQILIKLLGSPLDDIQSRASIILSDLACVLDNQTEISAQNGIAPLINLLDSELEDVLVNAVNAIRVMCTNHDGNQTLVAENGGVEPLIEFLTVNSDAEDYPDILQAAAASALAALCAGHRCNQDQIVAEGAVKPLVDLLKCRNVTVQVKSASALEALAENNPASQAAILGLNAPKPLIKLLKVWNREVKEQGACTLWALAGHTTRQQKMIAERIGINQLIDMLLYTKSEKLQYVGGMAVIALCRTNIENQIRIKEENGILPIIRVLRSHKTSERVLLTVIRCLGTLCVGVAHRCNKVTQAKIAEENAISTLVQLLVTINNEMVKVEVAISLACIILCNKENQTTLTEEPAFNFGILLQLFKSKDEIVRLKAGTALATFAFNNTSQQYSIREAGGIRMSAFEPFLNSDNESYQANAAFQIVVLARVIVDRDQVTLSAEGVTRLVMLLQSEDENTVILSGRLMSSLAHTRAGIPDAMVTTGAVEVLLRHLESENETVQSAAAVALGYLSFNRTAARLMLQACRAHPQLYELLVDSLEKDAKICKDFTENFRRQKIIGLPSRSLEINGGPPVIPPKPERGFSRLGRRPKTSMSLQENRIKKDELSRAQSAPAISQALRALTVKSILEKHSSKYAQQSSTPALNTEGKKVIQRKSAEVKQSWT
ncbi:ankyrin and armadillo repeat-containing protein-like isoform X3 [Ptychodera flava]|uniref:ankyrin and armadillo repeat-containing protein-like isoform X3 n=1 Tax=Ptychodera flava TaxID=63121 RepID=UPI00396A3A01